MATGKTNNPEGINQYTKNGNSSEYRYSIGGYFATKKKQQELDSKASAAKIIAKAARDEGRKAVERQNEIIKDYSEASSIQRSLNIEKVNHNLLGEFYASNKPMKKEQLKNAISIYESAEKSKNIAKMKMDKENNTIENSNRNISNAKSTIKAASDYKTVSNPVNYSKNLVNQTVTDTKQIAENIRKRMWGQ